MSWLLFYGIFAKKQSALKSAVSTRLCERLRNGLRCSNRLLMQLTQDKKCNLWSLGVWRVTSAFIVGALLGWSLVVAFSAVEPCQASREWDVLRDIGIAQSFFDGSYPEDPVLSGEISWYNPLTGILLALFHKATGLSLMRLAVVLGPFINLIAPLGFYFLAARLFGRAAALAGLCLMLFGKDGRLPFWTCAYAPWLLAPMYSMGLLFFTLYGALIAFTRRKPGAFFFTGFLLGTTFLAHTAPALIAGGTMVLMLGWECLRVRGNQRYANRTLFGYFVLLLTVAFLVSLPYTGPILWRYQFRVLNPWPSLFASQNVELSNLSSQLLESINFRNATALLGLWTLFKNRNTPEIRLTLCWGVTACLLMIQHYIWQALRINDIVLSSLVPGHHSAIHLSCVRTVLFGVGITVIGDSIGKILGVLATSFSAKASQALRCATVGMMVLLSGIALYVINPYSRRVDFLPPGGQAYYELFERHLPMYQWIRDNTAPDTVFLCPDESVGILVVMPAARKIVQPMLFYSNPYVDRGILALRQESILKAIEKDDRETLCQEALPYSRLFLLLKEPVTNPPHLADEILTTGGLTLYELKICSKRF